MALHRLMPLWTRHVRSRRCREPRRNTREVISPVVRSLLDGNQRIRETQRSRTHGQRCYHPRSTAGHTGSAAACLSAPGSGALAMTQSYVLKDAVHLFSCSFGTFIFLDVRLFLISSPDCSSSSSPPLLLSLLVRWPGCSRTLCRLETAWLSFVRSSIAPSYRHS